MGFIPTGSQAFFDVRGFAHEKRIYTFPSKIPRNELSFYPRPAEAPELQRRFGSARRRSTVGSRPWVDPHRGSPLGRPTVGRSECLNGNCHFSNYLGNVLILEVIYLPGGKLKGHAKKRAWNHDENLPALATYLPTTYLPEHREKPHPKAPGWPGR